MKTFAGRSSQWLARWMIPSLLLICSGASVVSAETPADPYASLCAAARVSNSAFQRLAFMCDTFGSRFSGTTNLEQAIDWVLAEAAKDGFENVHGEEVTVPHWVRGAESLELLAPRAKPLPMIGLGGSVGTAPAGIEAGVLVVKGFDELTAHASEASGKIVLFNVPFKSYGETVAYRVSGPVEAAKVGAVAALVRSVTPYSLNTPHTGSTAYNETTPKIPAAAVTVEDAEFLQRLQDRNTPVTVRLKMAAAMLPPAQSRNVVAEIRGSEKPDEIVVVSGHIDCWDNTVGALDDAGGAMAAWEAVRLISKLGIKPKCTVRLVLWTNEENGLGGARAYMTRHASEIKHHRLEIESDIGVFKPTGFVGSYPARLSDTIASLRRALESIGAAEIGAGGVSSDLAPTSRLGVPCLELQTENATYFYYHHTAADTPDKIKPSEIQACAAAMAIAAWHAANEPGWSPPAQ